MSELLDKLKLYLDEKVLITAFSRGDLDVVKFIISIGTNHPIKAIKIAAHNGNLELVKYLHHTLGADCTVEAMKSAASNGRLEVVKYLHSANKHCAADAMEWAAKYGHHEVVEYLKSNEN